MSGLGGDGFYHVYVRQTGEAVVFNGTGPAPGAATPERYASGIPAAGPLAASVPGSVGAWGAMHARFGRRPWASLLEGAIHYARDGFGVTRACRHFAGEQVGALLADPRSARVFLREGRPPTVGATIVQVDLARTLERLAAAGAEDFYRGDLARALAAGCQAAGEPGDRRRPRRVRARGSGADRARLPRLHGPPGAAELHGLGAAPGARHRRALRPRRDGSPLRRPRPHARRGEEARLRGPRALERGPAVRRGAARRAPLARASRAASRRDRPEARGARRDGRSDGGRRHHVLLRGGRRRQRGLRHPEHQQRVRLRRHRGRHRHPPEQPHDALASRRRATRTVSRPASGFATR